MQRYFLEEKYEEIQFDKVEVTGEPLHHMYRVMRMKPGDQCFLAFSDQVVIQAQIDWIDEEKVILHELEKENQTKELPIAVTIASGFPKGDKLEWIVQKGSELGANQFLAFPSQFSVVKWDQKKQLKKEDRLKKIAQEAAEQSHRQVQPTIFFVNQLENLIEQFSHYDAVLVAYEESAKQGEQATLVQTLQSLHSGQSLLLIFGPEGGFAPNEIDLFVQSGAQVCGLGPRILRAETAPLYALSAISYHFELLRSL